MTFSKIYFISGGNRGIGLSFVKQLSSNSNNLVIASARNPDKAIELQQWSKEHPNTRIVRLDVSNEDSIASLPDQVSKFTDKIDVLISNAGIINEITKILETPASVFSKLFTVNSIGPVLLVRALNPFLSNTKSPKTIFISSIGGSIGGADNDGFSAYGASKAALNYFMRMLSLGSKTHTFVAFHPGLVDTDMAKTAFQQDTDGILSGIKKLTPDESVSLMLKIINGLGIKDSGSYLDYEGKPLPF